MRFVVTGDPNPHWFGHPGSTVIHLLGLVFYGYWVVGYIAGWFSDLQSFEALFSTNPTSFYLIGRALAVVPELLLGGCPERAVRPLEEAPAVRILGLRVRLSEGRHTIGHSRCGHRRRRPHETAQLFTARRISCVGDVLSPGLGAWIGGIVAQRCRDR